MRQRKTASPATNRLAIDPEFSALIPPLTTEERAQLEANLLAEGAVIRW
jgi:hypothetical protein